MASGACLRYHDPRRFGCFSGSRRAAALLSHLGPEPLSDDFDGDYLYRLSRGRSSAVKKLHHERKKSSSGLVIFALTRRCSGRHPPPTRRWSHIADPPPVLADYIKQVLASAIEQGGTTLRDFVGGDGKPGYFAQQLYVYGRAGEACKRCGACCGRVAWGSELHFLRDLPALIRLHSRRSRGKQDDNPGAGYENNVTRGPRCCYRRLPDRLPHVATIAVAQTERHGARRGSG